MAIVARLPEVSTGESIPESLGFSGALAFGPVVMHHKQSNDKFYLTLKNTFLDFHTDTEAKMQRSCVNRSLSADSVNNRGRLTVDLSGAQRRTRSPKRTHSPSNQSTRTNSKVESASNTDSDPQTPKVPLLEAPSLQEDAKENAKETSITVPPRDECVPRPRKRNLTGLSKPTMPITTVMIRGIPSSYTPERLMESLQEAGLEGWYDFIYMPRASLGRARHSVSNLGYSFVNFVHPNCVHICDNALSGKALDPQRSTKVCAITPADIQGLANLRKHFRRTSVSRGSRGPLFVEPQVNLNMSFPGSPCQAGSSA